MVPYDPLDTSMISSGTHFIPNIVNLSFFSCQSYYRYVHCIDLSKTLALCFMIFSFFCFQFHGFSSFLYYVLPSACFTLLFSCFSRLAGSSGYWFKTSLFYQHKHFTKGEHLMLLNFPLGTVLAVSQNFWYIFIFIPFKVFCYCFY